MDFNHWKGRRFYLFSSFLKKHFPFKVGKITLDVGFSCPNIDGKVAQGGCIYCNNKSFSLPASMDSKIVTEQLQRGKQGGKKRPKKYLAYFQAYSNTYGEVERLKAFYDQALEDEDIIGLDIGTRPDCVPDEVLDLIESYAQDRMVWLEYGLQSASNQTLKKINRGHDVESFIHAVERTRNRNILICGHVILGFPWESQEEMMASVQLISDLKLDGIKIHHLYIAKDTPMEKGYQRGQFPVMTFDEYLSILCDGLEILRPQTTIHRLTGDLWGELLVAPQWNLGMGEVYQRVNRELERRGTYQGSKLQKRVVT